ncbi:MAG: GDYXXLXY domain-containing protein [Chloroflexi bacterium]|nr:GDYXXLXY domain-containing protein [Chloroflexota bacterium]
MSELFSRPLPKLIAVVAFQVLILLSVLGFREYTLLTRDTVLLKLQTTDPQTIAGSDSRPVRYEISTVDVAALPGDDEFMHYVYVELGERSDGTWQPLALHNRRDRSYDNAVLIKSDYSYYGGSVGRERYTLRYGIEDVYVPDDAAASLPSGSGHTIAVEVKVDRFGQPEPVRFLINGEPYELEER